MGFLKAVSHTIMLKSKVMEFHDSHNNSNAIIELAIYANIGIEIKTNANENVKWKKSFFWF